MHINSLKSKLVKCSVFRAFLDLQIQGCVFLLVVFTLKSQSSVLRPVTVQHGSLSYLRWLSEGSLLSSWTNGM